MDRLLGCCACDERSIGKCDGRTQRAEGSSRTFFARDEAVPCEAGQLSDQVLDGHGRCSVLHRMPHLVRLVGRAMEIDASPYRGDSATPLQSRR